MAEEKEKDPNAEMEVIMANPVLATAPSTKDQSAYKISSREEEQAWEIRAFQRKEPIQPNDPFGRRVFKESNGSSKTTGGGNSTGSDAGAAGANPFKKKSGSDTTGLKGFGRVGGWKQFYHGSARM